MFDTLGIPASLEWKLRGTDRQFNDFFETIKTKVLSIARPWSLCLLMSREIGMAALEGSIAWLSAGYHWCLPKMASPILGSLDSEDFLCSWLFLCEEKTRLLRHPKSLRPTMFSSIFYNDQSRPWPKTCELAMLFLDGNRVRMSYVGECFP